MENGWHKIWAGKKLDTGSAFKGTEELFMELKMLTAGIQLEKKLHIVLLPGSMRK